MSRTGRRRRRYRSREEVAALVEEFDSSGLSRRAFASRRNLSLSTLSYWLRRRAANAPARGPQSRGPRFVPVVVREDGDGRVPAHQASLRVELTCGRVVVVPAGFPGAKLSRLVTALEAGC